jgi:hypothetical protein
VRCGSDYSVDRLDEAVRVASKPTPEPILQIIAGACSRIPLLTLSGKAAAIGQLIKLDAWVDAALTLIELELPGWKLRRLICEDGEWFCSLSRQPNLPATLDDTADGTHEVMSLAILLAFLEARRRMATVPQSVAAVPAVDPAAALVCCDNFARKRRSRSYTAFMSKALASSRIHMPLVANLDQPKETIREDPDERHFHRSRRKTDQPRGQAVAVPVQTRRVARCAGYLSDQECRV